MQAGLTGGLASGKSFISQALAARGCVIIEADRLGHEVLLTDGPAFAPTVDHFGPSILASDGSIDRKLLAGNVFNSPAELELLNSIVHPAVYARANAIAAATPSSTIVIFEAAILIETGSYTRFDKLIVAICTREQQIERALQRPGATLPDVLARLDRQLPLEEKRKYADYVIDTSGSKEDTLRQTGQVYDCLRSLCDHARCS